ncbi:MAG: hypothetical protein VXW49_11710 [Pseudomonadota bacterium]|nr:hypothetical protein [Pseudomonadota bacterium]
MINANTIEFAPLLPLPGLILAAAIVLLIAGFSFYTRTRGAVWRISAAVLLLLLLLRPALVSESREPLKDVAVLAIDESPSTEVADRDAEIAVELERLKQRLGDYAQTLEVKEVRFRHGSIAEAGDGTKLFTALQEALGSVPRGQLAGAIVLSDGQIHDIPEPLRPDALAAPVHVRLAGRRDMRDRRLIIKNAPAYGIVGSTVSFTIRVEDTDANSGNPAQLTVRKDGRQISQRNVAVGRDTTISVEIDHGGNSVIEFLVDRGPDELTIENNRAVLSVNGVRDRLRVLLVSGEPHPGERTWRNLLKSDPSVDLVHFTILRPPEKQDGTPINELSLISFPTRELFEVKLKEFDLVIFDRYRRRGVLPPVYLQNIVEYVRDGGALLKAVGPSYAGPFSIYRTPLGELLPGAPTGKLIDKPFRPQVTDLGQRHPVTANLPETRGEEAPTWGRWLRQIDIELARGNVLMSGADTKPLLVLDRFHEGRVAQFNSDHIWLWARGFEGGGPQAELLRRLAHWLMKEPDLEEDDLRASFDGQNLKIEHRSLETKDKVEIELTDPVGETQKLQLGESKGGRSTREVPVDQPGLYTIRRGDKTVLLAVGALNPREFADLRSTEGVLRPVTEASGGSLTWIASDGPVDIRRIRPNRRAAGSGWIGLRRNDGYLVTGVDRVSLMPPLLALLLVAGLVALAWKQEAD